VNANTPAKPIASWLVIEFKPGGGGEVRGRIERTPEVGGALVIDGRSLRVTSIDGSVVHCEAE
jgi:hypothetical protein